MAAGSVVGVVFADSNGNGIQDNGEAGIPGATVTLSDDTRSADLTHSVVTDSAGVYRFTDVPAGQYTLRFQLPAGHGGVNPPSVPVGVGGSGVVTAAPAAVQTTFRLYLPGVRR